MSLLLYMGVPPSLMVPLMMWTEQLKILKLLIAVQYLQAIARQQHMGLPPGEQYRQHLKAGGYRP